ncbi:LytR C-terminal domain-containing protein [Streptomyces spongiae]|uniref:LytR family transcriptional regulator n=1 Tax=Streptomyces spongiae TaxID=565072 RepID=A0A5N8XZ43_9ACTN|nr:LytR C-terminal domain-containing protein [Streptomyces spongiae]MPY63975.1 LytR family transcriptional regulator [Streptomyces spongiae]
MGGQYRITGGKYPRMRRPRRRRRLVLTVVASMTVVGLIGWGTVQLIDVFTGGGDQASAAGSKAACAKDAKTKTRPGTKASPSPTNPKTPAKTTLPRPAQITVNVLNATPRSGLAKETAEELKKRGFRIGDVGNATKEYDKKVDGPAVLLGAKTAAGSALPVLRTQLPGAELKTDARTKATEVDLIIGTDFKELLRKKAADKALTALAKPTPKPTTARKSC